MGVLDSLQEGISNLVTNATNVLTENKEAVIGATIGAATIGAGVGIVAAVKKRKKAKKKTTKRKSKSKSKYKRRSKRGKHRTGRRKGRRTPRTAGKGRDRSTKRIRYTKKGQPYVILKSGKARFVKKSSAKRSHKRKGGRY